MITVLVLHLRSFTKFVKQNGIQHVRTAPYHTASNGLAERAVQIIKNCVKQMVGGNMQNKITRFLSRYRITPQSTTGEAPSVLLMNKVLRSRLDQLKSSVKERMVCAQDKQQNKHAQNRVFEQGDTIFTNIFGKGKLWLPGFISEKNGPVSYKIKLADGRIASRHQDHIRLRFSGDDTCDIEKKTSTLKTVN